MDYAVQDGVGGRYAGLRESPRAPADWGEDEGKDKEESTCDFVFTIVFAFISKSPLNSAVHGHHPLLSSRQGERYLASDNTIERSPVARHAPIC